MHVEVIGCTSSGKTTLTRALEKVGRSRGLAVRDGDDLVLGRLAWIRGGFLRRRLVDAISLPACLRARGEHSELLHLALEVSRTTPGGWTNRLNRARNALRKVGIYVLVQRRRRSMEHVLVDNEGVLQAAHNLFVHTGAEPELEQVDAFARIVPLPDAVVYRRIGAATLVERTLARGHRRVPQDAPEAAARFVRHASATFDRLTSHPRVRSRLVLADGEEVSVAEGAEDPRLSMLADWVRAGLQFVQQERGEGLLPDASSARGAEA